MRKIPNRTKSVHAGVDGASVPELVPDMALVAHADRRGGAACCTVHKIAIDRNGRPKLEAGTLATTELLTGIVEKLKGSLPGAPPRPQTEGGFTRRDVIFKREGVMAWLRPASVETILIGGRLDKRYSGKRMALPEMLMCFINGGFFTLCPIAPGRPGPETEVCAAPFPNTAPDGRVCLNGGLTFDCRSPDFIEKAEEIYLNTAFTHPNMSHPLHSKEKLNALWETAIGRAAKGEPLQPDDFLTPGYPKFKLKEVLENARHAQMPD